MRHRILSSVALAAGLTVALSAARPRLARPETGSAYRFKAVAFDYFVLFNPDSIVAEAERVFPGKGRELANLWRTRQFEYSWLRSITDRYVDFFAITDGALTYAISNFSPMMLRSNAESAGLLPFFDALVSTDANHTYKPDPRAYRLGMDRLHLARPEIVFAAFGGWDAAGAKSFGYPTVWVNRFNQPLEELGVRPDRISTNLDGLLDFVLTRPPAGRR